MHHLYQIEQPSRQQSINLTITITIERRTAESEPKHEPPYEPNWTDHTRIGAEKWLDSATQLKWRCS